MQKEQNPFIVAGKIKQEYFCDRVKETETIIKHAMNGNNLVIMSPRRMGKTGLIKFCYDKNVIKKEYHTFFIDILHTKSLREFTYLLGREIYKTLLPKGNKFVKTFIHALKSINGKFGFDVTTNLPSFSITLGDIDRPEYTLEDIFNYLSNAEKPCIVAIDEFQQIAKYPEENVEALLRTYIQHASNCNFIFAGSRRHLMQEMFLSAKRPFYNSTSVMELKAIPSEIYIPFIKKHFENTNRKINEADIEYVYDIFDGHTFYIQKTFNETFANTCRGGRITREDILSSINYIVEERDIFYRELLSNISEKQKEILYAIAKETEAKNITSEEFIKTNSLSTASAVQYAVKMLLDRDIITRNEQIYSVNDKFFSIWLKGMYGVVV
jgi:hypothetical protein